MNYIILDLEWNQCPEGKAFEKKQLPFEILEIGAVKMNQEAKEISRFSQYIRPAVYHALHFRTQEILKLELSSLKKAPSFREVFSDFWEWCGEDFVFLTWGSLDLFELQRNLTYYGMTNPFPFPLRYYNVQKLFSLVYEDGKTMRSLEYAIDFLKLEKDHSFHNALSDSVYTAQIFARLPRKTMMKNFSIDYFRVPHNRKEEIYAVFDRYSKFVSREFSTKTDLMRDKKVTSVKCYLCYRSARRITRWFAAGNQNYFCLSYCEKHGWLRGKIHIRKTLDGHFFCIKTMRLITQEEADQLLLRQSKKS